MRNAGATLDAIAKKLGTSTYSVSRDIELSLLDIVREPAEHRIANQLAIINDLRKGNYLGAVRGDKGSGDVILKTLDHEAKLLGLYAPTRVNVGVSDDDFATTMAALLGELGRVAPEGLLPETREEIRDIPGPLAADDGVDPEIIDLEVENTAFDDEEPVDFSSPWVTE